MPSNRADMYLVMLGAWRMFQRGPCGVLAEDAVSDYLDRLWWSLNTAELIYVTEAMQADANRLRAAKRV